jgi:hypothetical protein
MPDVGQFKVRPEELRTIGSQLELEISQMQEAMTRLRSAFSSANPGDGGVSGELERLSVNFGAVLEDLVDRARDESNGLAWAAADYEKSDEPAPSC